MEKPILELLGDVETAFTRAWMRFHPAMPLKIRHIRDEAREAAKLGERSRPYLVRAIAVFNELADAQENELQRVFDGMTLRLDDPFGSERAAQQQMQARNRAAERKPKIFR